MSTPLPKWVGTAGPEELGQLYDALTIAWEALARIEYVEMSETAYDAMRKIEKLGGTGE